MSEQSMVVPISSGELERALEERVLAAGSVPGAKLESERALAEEFGVGRPLIREVLRRLEERGLITVLPGRGAFVHDRPPTQGGGSVELLTRRGRITPRQLIVARSMLESEAAALAATYRGEADLVHMTDSLTVLSSAESEAAQIDADVQFHEAIAIASGNTVLQIMFGSIRPHIRGIVARSLSDVVIRDLALPDRPLRDVLARRDLSPVSDD